MEQTVPDKFYFCETLPTEADSKVYHKVEDKQEVDWEVDTQGNKVVPPKQNGNRLRSRYPGEPGSTT